MLPSELRNQYGQIWLNIASSSYPIADFANLDNHVLLYALKYPRLQKVGPGRNRNMLDNYLKGQKTAPYFKHNCRKKPPITDNTADPVLCSHFLEHVCPVEADEVLADFLRVLKPGGTAHIIVQDTSVHVIARKPNSTTDK
jgi:ubiquinone/menaquinone biosynthesis C-methylase UbiE